MGPKVEAALRFVEGGGARAVITSLEHIADAVTSDDAGTVLQKDPPAPRRSQARGGPLQEGRRVVSLGGGTMTAWTTPPLR